MGEVMAFDHIHLISRDPKAAADWYKEIFGGLNTDDGVKLPCEEAGIGTPIVVVPEFASERRIGPNT